MIPRGVGHSGGKALDFFAIFGQLGSWFLVGGREGEEQLLAYCQLETLAMVRLWEVFRGRV